MGFKSAAELAAEARARIERDYSAPVTADPREMSRETPVEPDGDELEVTLDRARAFLTEANGKTLLTAPAAIVHEDFEKAMAPNPFFMYVAGAFVGAEQANRNGAFWSTSDLEIGAPTVQHGPLNWLHEERKIVGALAQAKLVKPSVEQAALQANPRIDAMAAVWKYIWPQESTVMEMAAEQGKLWYSMECVSETVNCVDHECGKYPYMDVMRQEASVCEHVRLKTGTRRFEQPAFLGGAVIVPPVRPGWADANLSLMKQAASYSEKSYEQAGKPTVDAGEWERLMAQVLSYAGVTA